MSSHSSLFSDAPEGLITFLMNAALIATNTNQFTKAQTIYNGALAIKPNNSNIILSMSATLFAGRQAEVACNLLKDLVDREPQNDLAKGFLAFYYCSQENNEWKSWAKMVLDSGKDSDAVELVKSLCEDSKTTLATV